MKKKQARARRQRVPAFGEWNHAYGYGGGGGDQRPVVTHYDLDSAMQMQARRLVVAIPAVPPKHASKVVKWRQSATATLELEDEDGEHEEDEKKKQLQQQHLGLDVVVELGLGGAGAGAARKQQGKQQSPVVGYQQARRRRAAVKTVDQDLYHIPPDMLCHEPRKRLTRKKSLWTGCLGLSCVVA